MLICRNCSSKNTPGTIKCSTCSMKGMLIKVSVNKEEKKDRIKPIYDLCKNCGTNDIGMGNKCMKCNFPLPKDKRVKENDLSNSKTNIS